MDMREIRSAALRALFLNASQLKELSCDLFIVILSAAKNLTLDQSVKRVEILHVVNKVNPNKNKSLMFLNCIDATAWYYFHSTIVQANAALLSVLAVFVVFRAQAIDSISQSIENRIVTYLGQFMRNPISNAPTAVPFSNIDSLPNVIDEIADGKTLMGDPSAKPNADALRKQPYWRSLIEQHHELRILRSDFIHPLRLRASGLIGLTLVSLSMLPHYGAFCNYSQLVILLTIVSESLLMYLLFRYAYFSVVKGKTAIAKSRKY